MVHPRSQRPLLVRNRNLRLVWLSQVVSQLGDRMFQIALIWWVVSQGFEFGGAFLGLTLVATVLPSVLLSGQIARRIETSPMRRILQGADATGAVVSLALFGFVATWGNTLPAGLTLSVLFVATLVFSTCQAHITPTLNASVSQVVPPRETEGAMALLSSTTTLASIGGAVMGAMVVEKLGLHGVVLVNGLSFAVSFLFDSQIKVPASQAFQQSSSTSSPQSSPAATSSSSAPTEEPSPPGSTAPTKVSWKKQHPDLVRLLNLFAAVNFFGTPVILLVPLYVKEVFAQGASELAWAEASLSAGLLLGSLASQKIGFHKVAEPFFAACLVLFGVGLATISLSPNNFVFCLLLAASTFALGVLNVRVMTHFQTLLKPEHKPAFFSTLQARVAAAVPLGFGAYGLLSDWWEPNTLSLFQGACVASLGFLAWHFSRKVSTKHQSLVFSAAVKAPPPGSAGESP